MSKMLDEIREQPEALEKTLLSGLRAGEELKRHLSKRRPRLIVLAARGTSDNAAHFGRYLLEITTGIPTSMAAPSTITLYEAKVDFRDVLLVAVSQSGESTDTNFVLERAKEQGALNVGVTNEASSTLAKLADHVLFVKAGRERSVAATKTYTGQLLMFYLLSHALGGRIHTDDLHRIPILASSAVGLLEEIGEKVERYRFMRSTVVVGRGLNYANALEFGLKLKETCYVVAEGFSSADFLHGPIAMVEESFPMFLFAPPGVTWPSIREMIEKLRQRKAETLVITDEGNREALELCERRICVPVKTGRDGSWAGDLLSPIPYIIPAQLFAARLAAEKGLDPDRPRTLSKVTKTL
jgi:glucosamine--fructose-6-phosphate aminotransferase (isomerizing)